MLWHYFITLDKSEGVDRPTYNDFQLLLSEVCDQFSFYPISSHPIHSIEFKEKGSLRRHTKIYDYPHYHCIVGSWSKVFYPVFKRKGWMIFIKELHSPADLLKTSGYIYKGHIPNEQILCLNSISHHYLSNKPDDLSPDAGFLPKETRDIKNT